MLARLLNGQSGPSALLAGLLVGSQGTLLEEIDRVLQGLHLRQKWKWIQLKPAGSTFQKTLLQDIGRKRKGS
jgi:hypothetical protein